MTYILTNINNPGGPVLITYFQNYALRILLRGLKEQTGPLLSAKSSCDMNTTLSILTNYTRYNGPRQSKSNTRKITNTRI